MTGPATPDDPRSAPHVEPLLVVPVTGLPEVAEGDDLGALLADSLLRAGLTPEDGDVLVVSSKVVSKAAGLRAPAEHRVGLVLAESDGVVAERATPGGITRIVRSLAGPVLAGAGIDGSNVGPDDRILLLPRDPDAAASSLRTGVLAALDTRSPGATPRRFGVIVSDSAGRPWRAGLADIALGAAGMPVTDDLRGGRDADGRPLAVTVRAIADELASAADLVKGKATGVPAALVRGLMWPEPQASPAAAGREVDHAAAPQGARSLVRADDSDWFGLGRAEAVRAALGVRPGTHAAADIGIPAAGPEDLEARVARACRLAAHDPGLGEVPAGHPRARLVGPRPPLRDARLDVTQFGVTVEAPDEFTLGLAVARLLVALAGEDVAAALARTEPPGPGRGPRALVLFTGGVLPSG